MTDFGGSKTPKNERDYWQTPIEIFNALDREFGFWLDAAASESNALCAHGDAGNLKIDKYRPGAPFSMAGDSI
ncbi:phage N-6-adenine-methyltransferase, partial [Klebsiella pneumoniae]|uniref:phage N-6-adenine-methyltransferase n=1 Tax=Klebsiella pneumoniae TaxID=573 RepID=UPI001D187129